MAVRLFQTVIYQMQSALAGRKAGVLDENGIVVACTDVTMVGQVLDYAAETARDTGDVYSKNDKTFRRLGGRNRSDYIVFCDGDDESSRGYVGIICVSLSQLKQYYDEKYDKISFIKNILKIGRASCRERV